MLGLDALSLDNDVSGLRRLALENGGAFFERAVTPGLLTNSVWTSIITHRSVRETGVFLTYQAPDWQRSRYHLVREAKRKGYDTWSFFGDQFTTYVGSAAGFDHDRSGPVGWLQLATSADKNASVLLPVLMSRLPALGIARTPRNQSNTYCYDLRAELQEILTARHSERPTFVAAHLDYLHQSAYPRLSELTASERAALQRAPVTAARDLSLHWQYPPIRGDVLELYRWKIRHLQHAVREELRNTGYLRAERENRLLLFSDHGARVDLRNDNFAHPRYYNVVLVTFGVATEDPSLAVSLQDLGPMAGFADASRAQRSRIAVEYYNTDSFQEWEEAIRTASFEPDGKVTYRPELVARFWDRLRTFHPPFESDVDRGR